MSVFLLLPLLLFLSTEAMAISPALTLLLGADKAQYKSGDRIDLTVTFENKSEQLLTINRRLAYPGPHLKVEITGPAGRGLRWLTPAPPPPVQESDLVQLPPGQHLRVTLPDIGRHLFDKFDRPGDYRMRAMYLNQDNGGQWNRAAWTGAVESNVITVRWGE